MGDNSPQKTAIVTGGSRGIGKACALTLARAGFDVALTYVSSNPDPAKAVAGEIEALGRKALAIRLDVADSSQAQDMVTQVHETFGRIDTLVNNAGITRDTLLMRMSDDDWRQVIDTNLSGAFYVTRPVAKIMVKQRTGSIVNITSIVGITGNAGQANYAASKAGIIGFTKSLAKELASRQITVNAIAPGFIATDMTEGLPADKIMERIPLGRLGQADDIANAVLFLVTSGAYVTGQVLQVDGGLVL